MREDILIGGMLPGDCGIGAQGAGSVWMARAVPVDAGGFPLLLSRLCCCCDSSSGSESLFVFSNSELDKHCQNLACCVSTGSTPCADCSPSVKAFPFLSLCCLFQSVMFFLWLSAQ